MNTAPRTNYGSTLGDLLVRHVDETVLASCADIVVDGLQMDSRQVKKGDVFFALFGKNHDARDYIDVAIDHGAVAVVADASGDWQGLRWAGKVPVFAVPGLRSKLGEIAANFYQQPSHAMPVIGVTGTNGKTSCTQFIAQMLNYLGQRCGVVGTLGSGVYPDLKDTGFTTPDPLLLQAALADFRDQHIAAVAMEASSQGLHQHRLQAVEFHTAVFTNLTRDHLDYHGTMQSYAESKRRLFESPDLKVGVVNMDDDHAVVMLNALPRSARSYTFSVGSQLANVYARKIEYRVDGFDLEVCTPWGEGVIRCHLLGAFNISNLLAAVTAVMTLPAAYALDDVLKAASAIKAVDGRMVVVGSVDGMTAVVDYAHTPDGLRSALEAVRQHASGKVWCVFGCGGNRDQGKRPLMAEVAESLADHVIVTDDNPRLENADDIVRQIMLGFVRRDAVQVERDRAQAIRLAVSQAGAGDVVLVAGKGHENYQDIGGQRMAFSDASQVRLALQQRKQANSHSTGASV